MGVAVEEYDVVLLGEHHNDRSHGDLEATYIEEVDPNYVLVEAPEDVDLQQAHERYKQHRTLKQTIQSAEAQYGKTPLTTSPESILDQAHDAVENGRYESCPGILPETTEELLTIPAYDIHPAAVSYINKSWKEAGEAEDESLQNYIDDAKTAYKEYRDLSKMQWAKHRLFDNISNELDQGEIELVPWDSSADRNVGPSQKDPVKMITGGYDELREQSWKRRETAAAEQIQQYAREDDAPIVAILGERHIEDDSQLCQLLDEQDFAYTPVPLSEESPYNQATV